MANFPEHFERQYQSHLKHLKLKGLQPKTIDAYARGMRRMGEYFSYQVDPLSEDQLTDYFTEASRTNNLIMFNGCFLTRNAACRCDRADRVEVSITGIGT